MPMMKSPYDHVINSLSGHCIHFEANVPVYAPDAIVSECLAVGIQPTEEQAPVVAAQPETSDNEDDDVDVWANALDQAIMIILTRGDPADFTAQEMPKVNKVIAEMSPEHHRPTATDISEAYQRLQENIDLAE